MKQAQEMLMLLPRTLSLLEMEIIAMSPNVLMMSRPLNVSRRQMPPIPPVLMKASWTWTMDLISMKQMMEIYQYSSLILLLLTIWTRALISTKQMMVQLMQDLLK